MSSVFVSGGRQRQHLMDFEAIGRKKQINEQRMSFDTSLCGLHHVSSNVTAELSSTNVVETTVPARRQIYAKRDSSSKEHTWTEDVD